MQDIKRVRVHSSFCNKILKNTVPQDIFFRTGIVICHYRNILFPNSQLGQNFPSERNCQQFTSKYFSGENVFLSDKNCFILFWFFSEKLFVGTFSLFLQTFLQILEKYGTSGENFAGSFCFCWVKTWAWNFIPFTFF